MKNILVVGGLPRGYSLLLVILVVVIVGSSLALAALLVEAALYRAGDVMMVVSDTAAFTMVDALPVPNLTTLAPILKDGALPTPAL